MSSERRLGREKRADLMDYFYVGNDANSVGLNDIYDKVQVKANEKSSLGDHFHHFSTHASLANGMAKNLISELDLVYSWTISPHVKLNAGYSQLFVTESMATIKGRVYTIPKLGLGGAGSQPHFADFYHKWNRRTEFERKQTFSSFRGVIKVPFKLWPEKMYDIEVSNSCLERLHDLENSGI